VAVMTVSVDPAHRARTQKESDSGCLSGVGAGGELHQQHSLNYAKGSSQTIEYLYKLGHRSSPSIPDPGTPVFSDVRTKYLRKRSSN